VTWALQLKGVRAAGTAAAETAAAGVAAADGVFSEIDSEDDGFYVPMADDVGEGD